jgi:hypothetical protein
MYEGNVVTVTNCGVVQEIVSDDGKGYLFNNKEAYKKVLNDEYERLGDEEDSIQKRMREIEEELSELD